MKLKGIIFLLFEYKNVIRILIEQHVNNLLHLINNIYRIIIVWRYYIDLNLYSKGRFIHFK